MALPQLQEPLFSNNANLADNLLNLMEKAKVTDSDLARALDLPYNTIKRITSGETTDPKLSTLSMIADYFQIGIDALLHGGSMPFAKAERPISVPILSWEDISMASFPENIHLAQWQNWVPVATSGSLQLSENAYAIKSKKFMEPRFPSGTTFIIDPNEKPHDGDIVLVKILETNEVTMRELEIDPPLWQLHSVNSSSQPIQFDNKKYRIMGVSMLTILQSR